MSKCSGTVLLQSGCAVIPSSQDTSAGLGTRAVNLTLLKQLKRGQDARVHPGICSILQCVKHLLAGLKSRRAPELSCFCSQASCPDCSSSKQSGGQPPTVGTAKHGMDKPKERNSRKQRTASRASCFCLLLHAVLAKVWSLVAQAMWMRRMFSAVACFHRALRV